MRGLQVAGRTKKVSPNRCHNLRAAPPAKAGGALKWSEIEKKAVLHSTMSDIILIIIVEKGVNYHTHGDGAHCIADNENGNGELVIEF